jgi:hypothetical protein
MPLWTDVEIVTLAEAKQHLRITSDAEDADLSRKLDDAHGLVLDYIARPDDAEWTAEMEAWDDESAPRAVHAAILRTFGDLTRFRGNDDDPSETRVDGGYSLSPRARGLLSQYKDPTLA